MEIDKDCAHYLQSNEVIEILQKQNILLQNKVFDCLRRYKHYFYSKVPLRHNFIPNDILYMCAEDAFITTEEIFFRNVKNNKFESLTDNCLGYFRIIFKRNYFELYQKEAERKIVPEDYLLAGNVGKSFNEGEKKLDKKDFIALKVQLVLDKLSDEDKRIYHLRYIENLKVNEIAAMLQMQPRSVSNRLLRFHERFGKAWTYQNKNN